MIPRYLPDLALPAWGRWLVADTNKVQDVQAGFLRILNGNENTRSAFAFVRARQSLYVYFKSLRQNMGNGTVLIPAQICPIVPFLVRESGFTVRFVDSDVSYPTPSATQYIQAMDQDTVGIIISPLYGYIQEEWNPLLEKLDRIKLVLDLAQGIGLREHINPLFQKADAVVYSFGLGKGLDTGGSLLFTYSPMNVTDYNQNGKKHYIGIMFKGVLLQLLSITKLYRFLLRRFESAVDMEKKPSLMELSLRQLAPADIYLLWDVKLRSFLIDVERARIRAHAIGALPSVRKACRDMPIFCRSSAIHLRQVIRFKDVTLRGRVLNTLQQHGVDCVPAGEPLPKEYFADAERVAFPNAQTFCGDSIRLPFLGRMSDKQFEQFKQKLENAIAQHLP